MGCTNAFRSVVHGVRPCNKVNGTIPKPASRQDAASCPCHSRGDEEKHISYLIVDQAPKKTRTSGPV